MAETAQSSADETESKGPLAWMVPTWRDMALVILVGGSSFYAQDFGLELGEHARADAHPDIAACLNEVRGDITAADIARCEEVGFSKLGADRPEDTR